MAVVVDYNMQHAERVTKMEDVLVLVRVGRSSVPSLYLRPSDI